jgi:hypothetical protein
MGLKDRVFASDNRPTKLVEVPEWGESVTLRSPTASKMAALADKLGDGEITTAEGLRHTCELIAMCVVEDGQPVFGADDIERLMDEAPSVVGLLGAACRDITAPKGAAEGKAD